MESIRLLFLSKKIRIYLLKARKDDNIIKLSFEKDEGQEKITCQSSRDMI